VYDGKTCSKIWTEIIKFTIHVLQNVDAVFSQLLNVSSLLWTGLCYGNSLVPYIACCLFLLWLLFFLYIFVRMIFFLSYHYLANKDVYREFSTIWLTFLQKKPNLRENIITYVRIFGQWSLHWILEVTWLRAPGFGLCRDSLNAGGWRRYALSLSLSLSLSALFMHQMHRPTCPTNQSFGGPWPIWRRYGAPVYTGL